MTYDSIQSRKKQDTNILVYIELSPWSKAFENLMYDNGTNSYTGANNYTRKKFYSTGLGFCGSDSLERN